MSNTLARAQPRSDAAIDGQPPPKGAGYIEVEDVCKRYRSRRGETLALDSFSLSVAREEFIAVVGQSGCGKTTLLRILAGLIEPTEGHVKVAGQPLWDGGRRNDDALAKLGLVFQDANLFPWYSVEDNIALPLRLRGQAKRERHLARARAGRAGRPRGLRALLSRGSCRAACASASRSPAR